MSEWLQLILKKLGEKALSAIATYGWLLYSSTVFGLVYFLYGFIYSLPIYVLIPGATLLSVSIFWAATYLPWWWKSRQARKRIEFPNTLRLEKLNEMHGLMVEIMNIVEQLNQVAVSSDNPIAKADPLVLKLRLQVATYFKDALRDLYDIRLALLKLSSWAIKEQRRKLANTGTPDLAGMGKAYEACISSTHDFLQKVESEIGKITR